MTARPDEEDVIEFEPEDAPYQWAADDDERRRAFVVDRMSLAAAHWDRPEDVLDLMQRAHDWLKTGESKKPPAPTKLRTV